MLGTNIVLTLRMLEIVIMNFYHVSTYHTLKFTGVCTSNRIVCLLVLTHIINLTVGETFHVYFNCVNHGDCVICGGAVVVVESKLAVLEVYIILLIVGSEYFC